VLGKSGPDLPANRIRALLNSLDGAFLQIACWLLELSPEEIVPAKFTTGEIARRLGVSRATVVRFCRRLGYEGFPEFRAAWLQEMSGAAPDKEGEATAGFPEAARRVFGLTADSIYATMDVLDPAAFERVVAAMCRASLVIWFGLPGDSAYLALSGEHKMMRAARRSHAVNDVTQLKALSQTVNPGDVLLVFSQSGRWVFVAEAVQPFRSRGCLIVVVTSHAESPLAKVADEVLLTAARDVTLGGEPLGIRAAQLMLIDMLVLELTRRTGSVSLHWETEKMLQARKDAQSAAIESRPV